MKYSPSLRAIHALSVMNNANYSASRKSLFAMIFGIVEQNWISVLHTILSLAFLPKNKKLPLHDMFQAFFTEKIYGLSDFGCRDSI